MKLLKIAFLACSILFLSCDKDDDQPTTIIQNPVDALPELTHEGKNTIGCLVDGEVFLPDGFVLQGNKRAYYTSFTSFQIKIVKRDGDKSRSTHFEIITDVKGLEVGKKYYLKKPFSGTGSTIGTYNDFDSGKLKYDSYYTDNENIGEVIVNHIDYSNYTVSGTFWFDAVDQKGKVVEIRDGRFDMEFLN